MTSKGIYFAVMAAVLLIVFIVSLASNGMANDWSDEQCLVAKVEALSDNEDAEDAMADYVVHCCESDDDASNCRP